MEKNIDEREKHQLAAFCKSPSWGWVTEPEPRRGPLPDCKSNQRPFGLQDNAQPTEPCRSGLQKPSLKTLSILQFCFVLFCFQENSIISTSISMCRIFA